MAQLVIAAAGSAIGGAVLGTGVVALGLTGNAIGWTVGSLIGSMFSPTQKSQGPRLSDLTVTGSAYGTPIPYLVGGPRVAPQIIWASPKHEIATTTEQGKGGGGSEYTSYTYTVDLLLLLSINSMQGVSRIWNNGKLIYTRLDAASSESQIASDDGPLWSRLTFYDGNASQMPDPTYEAAVGTENALAFRSRTTIFIEGLQLGSSGQIPNLTYEIYSTGTETPADYLTRLQTDFVGEISEDLSYYAIGSGTNTGGTVHEGYYEVDINNSSRKGIAWTDAGLARSTGQEYTFEIFFEVIEVTGNRNGVVGLFDAVMFLTAGLQGSMNGYGGAVPSANEFAYSDTINGGHTYVASTDLPSSSPAIHHFAMSVAADATYSVYLDGHRILGPVAGTDFSNSSGNVYLGGASPSGESTRLKVYGVRVRREQIYSGASIAPPADSAAWGPAYRDYSTVTIGTETLTDTVSGICLRAGLTADQFDVTALASITQPVRAMAISQVSTARQVLDMLASAFFFEAVASDKLYFVPRGGAPVRTLAFDDLGWYSDGQTPPDPLALVDANELELPAQVALTYNAIESDYQTDTQYSDRLLSSMKSTNALTLPLGLTAAEAKKIADAMLADSVVGLLSTKISLGLEHADLEGTDVVLATGADGSTYRVRLLKRSDSGGVSDFDVVLDDASVLTQAGVTDGGTASQTIVQSLAATTLALLDIPLLRDADDAPGYLLAVSGGGASNWRSAGIYDSTDATTYTLQRTVDSQAVIGSATSVLANWTGGNVWDDVSTVTVQVDGELSSATSAAVIARRDVNAALIGDELVQYRAATLVSAGVYTLSGFLRGRRGTEWAMAGHLTSEQFVALGTSGMRFMRLQASELGGLRYVKAVTAGQLLSAVTAQTITPLGVSLKPLAPVLASADRSGSDTVLAWYRRSRLSSRITGPLAWSHPLGEASESYEIDVYADGTYASIVRTISASDTQVTYTAADQTTDFGSPPATLYLDIYQISATVGRGTALRAAV